MPTVAYMVAHTPIWAHMRVYVLENVYSDSFKSCKLIHWVTICYFAGEGDTYRPEEPIEISYITGEHGNLIAPRVYKEKEHQANRTKDKAEVFTPGWVVNAQNNLVDNVWFGRSDVFNIVSDDQKTMTATTDKIEFPDVEEEGDDKKRRTKKDMEAKTWQNYVRRTWLVASCGEAPYVVSRYDAATGKSIPIEERFGALDRKLRVIRENVDESVDVDELFS